MFDFSFLIGDWKKSSVISSQPLAVSSCLYSKLMAEYQIKNPHTAP
jgi:hypothetical protein